MRWGYPTRCAQTASSCTSPGGGSLRPSWWSLYSLHFVVVRHICWLHIVLTGLGHHTSCSCWWAVLGQHSLLLYCLDPGEHVKVPMKFADRKYDYVFFVVVCRKDGQFRLQDCRDHKKMQSFSGGKCANIFTKCAPKEIIWQVFAANNWSHISWPQSCRKAFADSFAYNIGSHPATFFQACRVSPTTKSSTTPCQDPRLKCREADVKWKSNQKIPVM